LLARAQIVEIDPDVDFQSPQSKLFPEQRRQQP
jgi:hypothetical protein